MCWYAAVTACDPPHKEERVRRRYPPPPRRTVIAAPSLRKHRRESYVRLPFSFGFSVRLHDLFTLHRAFGGAVEVAKEFAEHREMRARLVSPRIARSTVCRVSMFDLQISR